MRACPRASWPPSPRCPSPTSAPPSASTRTPSGFVELEQDGVGLGILRRDEVELHLWVADGSAKGAERELAGSASCRIEVTGVDELYEHCRGLGVVHPRAALTDQPWGTREFGALDPDGNLISLYERTR